MSVFTPMAQQVLRQNSAMSEAFIQQLKDMQKSLAGSVTAGGDLDVNNNKNEVHFVSQFSVFGQFCDIYLSTDSGQEETHDPVPLSGRRWRRRLARCRRKWRRPRRRRARQGQESWQGRCCRRCRWGRRGTASPRREKEEP